MVVATASIGLREGCYQKKQQTSDQVTASDCEIPMEYAKTKAIGLKGRYGLVWDQVTGMSSVDLEMPTAPATWYTCISEVKNQQTHLQK